MPLARGVREKPPTRRRSDTYSLSLRGGKLVHVTLSYYGDGRLSDLFVNAATPGSMLRTSFEEWARAVSKQLQYGAPVDEVLKTHKNTHCEGGNIHCPAVEGIHGWYASSLWDAVIQLVEAEHEGG